MRLNEIFFKKSQSVQVFADDREREGFCVARLKELGADVVIKRLEVGDFVLSERVCVERKSDSDFESSIVDGRLFQQAGALKENFASPIVAVVGRNFKRLHEKALRGALASLAVDYRIPLLFFNSEGEFAEFLYTLGEREQLKTPKEARVQFEKKRLSPAEQQRFVVESLPMIGPKNARNLLKHFGSIEAIVNADFHELQEVEGIGKTRAREIKRVLTRRYEEKEEPT